MPQPHKGENEEHYVHRAIPQIMAEGRPQAQSEAIAFSLWRNRRKKRRGKKSFTAPSRETKTYPATNRVDWTSQKTITFDYVGTKAQHGGRGGGMASDKFAHENPLPIGSQATLRQAVNRWDTEGKESFSGASQEQVEIVGHEATGVRVRNKQGQETVIPRSQIRGKTTGKGHRVPKPTGREAPGYREDSPSEHQGGGSCRVGQTARETGCTPAKSMAVSPAMSSVDATQGGSLREPSSHFGYLKPFHRRKLKRRESIDLKRNNPAILKGAACECAGEPGCKCAEKLIEARTKDMGPGWSYKYAAEQTNGYGLDLAFGGKPQFDETAFSITFPFAASHGRDRVGDFLDVGGIDTTNHRKNPVAYFDHGKSITWAIGKCEDPDGNYTVTIDRDRGLAIATVFLDKDPKNEEAQKVFSQFKQGILRAGSIGYRPLNKPKILPADPSRGIPQGVDLTSVELLEVTICTLPCNGDAVRRM